MQKKTFTGFRLYPDTIARLDALVESPPEWLSSIMPGPVKDRTDAVERLIFLAVKHASFGQRSEGGMPAKPAKRTPTSRTQKPKTARKR